MLSLGITVYLCHLVGFLYPSYASFKALETKDPSDDIQGAKVVYDKFVKPMLIKYASKIDPVFDTAQGVIEGPAIGMALNLAQQYGPDVAEAAMKMAQDKAAELAAQTGKKEGGKDN